MRQSVGRILNSKGVRNNTVDTSMQNRGALPKELLKLHRFRLRIEKALYGDQKPKEKSRQKRDLKRRTKRSLVYDESKDFLRKSSKK